LWDIIGKYNIWFAAIVSFYDINGKSHGFHFLVQLYLEGPFFNNVCSNHPLYKYYLEIEYYTIYNADIQRYNIFNFF
jgi:hypothetical protein